MIDGCESTGMAGVMRVNLKIIFVFTSIIARELKHFQAVNEWSRSRQ